MIRIGLTFAFCIALAFWLAADIYVGSSGSVVRYALLILLIGLVALALAMSFQQKRLVWRIPVTIIVCIVGAQFLWRDLIHPLPDFKLLAGMLFSAGPFIAALGIVALLIELREFRSFRASGF
ncbi:hypothetical protein [uncultured Erythrobacter sp.]|uniref:hypothetical protein n=1 Tax=uncultured Erythrobacter sp. TaxID=263913 RepID=UPI002618D3F0|nr:hypothetical protein [uncultured Erythrobacter sp.]